MQNPLKIRPILSPIKFDKVEESAAIVIKPLRFSVTLETVRQELIDEKVTEPSLPKSKWLVDELWKPSHISNEYFISTEGRCYSEKTKTVKNCKPESHGYISFGFMIDRKHENYLAHEMVAKTFIGARPANHYIDHIDRIQTNNKLINLRYVTPSMNNLNRTPVLQRGKPTGQYSLSGTFIKKWERARDIANCYNLDLRILTTHIRRETPYHGFLFKYIKTEIDGEEWKEITVATGKLKISTHGRVKNGYFEPHYGTTSSTGYKIVSIGDKIYQIHDLICEHFNGSKPSKQCIANHLDENRQNNHKDNLKWVSGIRENTEYSMGRKINQYDKTGNLIATHNSIIKASESTGVSATSIGRSCNNEKEPLSSDYIFKYEDNGVAQSQNKVTRTIIQSDLNGNEIKRFNSIASASREMKIAESTLHYYGKGNLTGHGFKWSFGEHTY